MTERCDDANRVGAIRVLCGSVVAVLVLGLAPVHAAASPPVDGSTPADEATPAAERLGLVELVDGSDAPEGGITVIEESADGSLAVARYAAPDDGTVDEVIAELETDPDVVVAEREVEWSIGGPIVEPVGDGWTTSSTGDPHRSAQWHLDEIAAPATWSLSGADAVVAVLDTGVDAGHPDLAGRVLPGWDFTTGQASSTDTGYHGTFVSGMITAVANNGIGIAPAVHDVSILPATVCNPSCWSGDIASAIVWAADHPSGVDVINMSLGGPSTSPAIVNAVAYARSKGVVVVASAGNDGGGENARMYPAAYSGVIGVGATAQGGSATAWASFGDWVDLSAPGESVRSTSSLSSYGNGSGTSFSAPLVSAAAALVSAQAPALTPDQIADALVATATDVHQPGWDPQTGAGRLDMAALMAHVGTPPPSPPPPTASPAPAPSCPSGGATHDQICRTYRAFFDRLPDAAGHAFWVDQRRAGVPLSEVANAFAGSREFRLRYGSLTNGQFVDLAYRNVLGRSPDPSGRQSWVNALASGQSRGQVMSGFSESSEFVNKTSTVRYRDPITLEIERLYLAYFLRAPDAEGLALWTSARRSGVPLSSVSQAFAASREFELRYGSLSNRQFVDLVYRNVLGRSPDPSGRRSWLDALASGQSRGQVMTGFSESREFRNKTRTNP